MQVLFRSCFDYADELDIAHKYCNVKTQRSECSNDTVIGRYSVLPYYAELETDLLNNNARLINSYSEHRWIADFEYYCLLKDKTFETWTDDSFYSCQYGGPFVVKGRTNSRKHQWKTHMFAETKEIAQRIAGELYNDPLLGEQGILYRKYIPLETFEIGINDTPFTNEWRFFFLRNQLLTYGYYWSQADKADQYQIPDGGLKFAQEIANDVQHHVQFFVLDIAKTQSGDWILVEINDGQMSGLSMCDPSELYRNLTKHFPR